MAIPGLHRKQR